MPYHSWKSWAGPRTGLPSKTLRGAPCTCTGSRCHPNHMGSLWHYCRCSNLGRRTSGSCSPGLEEHLRHPRTLKLLSMSGMIWPRSTMQQRTSCRTCGSSSSQQRRCSSRSTMEYLERSPSPRKLHRTERSWSNPRTGHPSRPLLAIRAPRTSTRMDLRRRQSHHTGSQPPWCYCSNPASRISDSCSPAPPHPPRQQRLRSQ
mmetsp:Transcript_12519/g.31575  ORF Transcript_12519/g.31575 Transcript_12519/m.31575 type:complete len:202 (-) Transcript_12519:374-979(-)